MPSSNFDFVQKALDLPSLFLAVDTDASPVSYTFLANNTCFEFSSKLYLNSRIEETMLRYYYINNTLRKF
jgi:hypothetical protein